MNYKVVFHWDGKGNEPPEFVKSIFEHSFVEQYNVYSHAMNNGIVEKANEYCLSHFGTTNCDNAKVWAYHLSEASRVVRELYDQKKLSDGTKEMGIGTITYYIEPIDMSFVMKIGFLSHWKNELSIYLTED